MLVLLLATFSLVLGQNIPHGHDLQVLIDKGFVALDHNPADNRISHVEWDALQRFIDNDTDGCITPQEYRQGNPQAPAETMDTFFRHFDHDNDGCLRMDDLNAEFLIVDKNQDGFLEKHEYEHYYFDLTNHILHGHGGGHVVG